MKIELESAQIVDLSTYFLVFENCIKFAKVNRNLNFVMPVKALK